MLRVTSYRALVQRPPLRERRADRRRLGGEFVLVDKTAEEVTTADRFGAAGQARRHSQLGRREVKAAMRSSSVVVPDVLCKDSVEVMPGDHEQVVEAVLADGAHPALGDVFVFGGRTGVSTVVAPIDAVCVPRRSSDLVTWTNVLRLGNVPSMIWLSDSQDPTTGNTGAVAVTPWWDSLTARGASSQLSRPHEVFGTHRPAKTVS